MKISKENALASAVTQEAIFCSCIEYLRNNGFNIPKEGAAARKWCNDQAKTGSADAQFANGLLLSMGLFGSKDEEAARFWFQSAADRDHPAGILMLAGYVELGSIREKPDNVRSNQLIRIAAEMGFGPALTLLGVRCLEGINAEFDRNKGMIFLEKAALVGDREGQYLLAINLLKEKSKTSSTKGIFWLKTAANNGYAGAHRHLGYFYGDGSHGLRISQPKSQHHFLMADAIMNSAYEEWG
jgi:uncharacterized protein